jgi:hypothetical protein
MCWVGLVLGGVQNHPVPAIGRIAYPLRELPLFDQVRPRKFPLPACVIRRVPHRCPAGHWVRSYPWVGRWGRTPNIFPACLGVHVLRPGQL